MNKSLNQNYLKISLVSTLIFILLIFLFSYITFRMQVEDAVLAYQKATQTVGQRFLIEQMLERHVIISESTQISEQRIMELFWNRYASYFMILLLCSIVYIILQLFGIHLIIQRVLRGVTTSLQDYAAHNLQNIPQEFQPLFTKITKIEMELKSVAEQNEKFRSFASHELRNQLTELESLCLQLDIHDEKFLHLMREMQDTIANLLMLSYVPTAMIKVPIDIVLITASIIDSFRTTAIHLDFDDSVIGARVLGTENLFGRLVYNLIKNALTYREANTEVTVKIQKLSCDTLTLEIKNENHAPDFEKIQGNGIGLNLVRHVTQLFEGYFYIEVQMQTVRTICTFKQIQS